MQTSAPHRWQSAREPCFVLFWWWTGSTALSGLKVHVLNKMLWPFTASARKTRASLFWLSQSSRNFNSEQRSTRFIILDKMFWPFTTSAHGACPFWLQFLSSDEEGVTHSPACFSIQTTSWAGAIHAKFICVVRACTRVIYPRPGVCQRLLA